MGDVSIINQAEFDTGELEGEQQRLEAVVARIHAEIEDTNTALAELKREAERVREQKANDESQLSMTQDLRAQVADSLRRHPVGDADGLLRSGLAPKYGFRLLRSGEDADAVRKHPVGDADEFRRSRSQVPNVLRKQSVGDADALIRSNSAPR